jgi:hypothetical protein
LECAIKSVLFQVLLYVDRVALMLYCSQLLLFIRENFLIVALEYSQLPLVECEVVLEGLGVVQELGCLLCYPELGRVDVRIDVGV